MYRYVTGDGEFHIPPHIINFLYTKPYTVTSDCYSVGDTRKLIYDQLLHEFNIFLDNLD